MCRWFAEMLTANIISWQLGCCCDTNRVGQGQKKNNINIYWCIVSKGNPQKAQLFISKVGTRLRCSCNIMQERSCFLQAACEKQPVTSEISGESDLEAEERKRGGGRQEKSDERSKAFLTFFFLFYADVFVCLVTQDGCNRERTFEHEKYQANPLTGWVRWR